MPSPEPKRVFIQTFGCQMNDYDSERMREVMRKQGWAAVDRADDADLVILNSCSIREKSEHKVQSAAGRLRELKAARPGMLVAISGCVAQQEGARLLARVPVADFTFGPDMIPSLPALLARHDAASTRRFAATDVVDVASYQFLDADPLPSEVAVTALVTIQKGCDNHCAYCIVPATRGREVSRPAHEVVAEVARFVALGTREVTLIGQNVNSYHGAGAPDGDDFAALLALVDAVPGLLRLRYTTSHPKDFTPKVAAAYGQLRTLTSWLHLPVQSGSSRTLRRMVRGYTREEYLRKLDDVRRHSPDISLSTDIIVGYPGESDADFAETLSLLRAVEYDSIYSFEYSERPETPALKLALRDDVPPDVKAARLQEVQALQREVGARRLARFVGRRAEVLIEGLSRHGDDQLCGRLPGNEMVNLPIPDGEDWRRWRGRLAMADIVGAGTHTLVGRLDGEVLTVASPAPSPRRLPMVQA